MMSKFFLVLICLLSLVASANQEMLTTQRAHLEDLQAKVSSTTWTFLNIEKNARWIFESHNIAMERKTEALNYLNSLFKIYENVMPELDSSDFESEDEQQRFFLDADYLILATQMYINQTRTLVEAVGKTNGQTTWRLATDRILDLRLTDMRNWVTRAKIRTTKKKYIKCSQLFINPL